MNLKNVLNEIERLLEYKSKNKELEHMTRTFMAYQLKGMRQIVQAIDNIKTTPNFDFGLFKRDNVYWTKIKSKLSLIKTTDSSKES